MQIEGFEMHHGISSKYPLYFQDQHIQGTFIHQIFDHNAFRTQYRHYVAPAQNQSNKKADIPPFFNKLG